MGGTGLISVVRRGVTSIRKAGSALLTGDITLSQGANITLTQTGQDIAIAAAAGGAGTDPPEGSYAPGSYTIATGKFRTAVKRQQFTGTQRLTIQGTGRLSISN